MTFETVKKRKAMTLPLLWRTALKSIYEPKRVLLVERGEMERSIVDWANHLEYEKDKNGGVLMPGTPSHEHQLMLEIIGSELKKDMAGELDNRKEQFRRWNIDYRKFYRLPNSITQKDIAEGQKSLKEHMITNKEDYK